ncbi:DUF72 domain-containing protein [Pontibacter qinzhouensis]|uniref:DUF72 domain-containing protein n=2 Tax=Pontibacter qinzhouensis TaxID=2603253 RepID=A0A5C8KDX7_9BACT|nr:DUF72 domain-containing protein [Pontibacter qinzhouensis]
MGNFYPEGVKPKDFTSHYVQHFSTVEVNNSFYKLPSAETFANWRKSVPPDFLFSVKASRYITHMKKLKDPQQSIARFFENANALEEKLGPILFQLPPGWAVNETRLADFLAALPSHYRYTFEFRHHSWYTPGVLELLRKHQAAFCIYELEWHLSPMEVTTNFVYVRLHGPEGKYAGSYTDDTLRWWAGNCRNWQQQGLDVYIYFDNDQYGFAAFNASRLQEILREQSAW